MSWDICQNALSKFFLHDASAIFMATVVFKLWNKSFYLYIIYGKYCDMTDQVNLTSLKLGKITLLFNHASYNIESYFT